MIDSDVTGSAASGVRPYAVAVADRQPIHPGDTHAATELQLDIADAADPKDAADPGIVRAGMAAAARRRELDISQRSLAADGIINAGALIAFEKGRSWPREKTRAKLEEVLRWPPGTIARIRKGGSVPGADTREKLTAGEDQEPLVAAAVMAAVDSLGLAIDALPPVDDPDFTERVANILVDLRRLEAVAARATRITKVTPALLKALSAVRHCYNGVMLAAAAAPGATLGQRLYAARRGVSLSIAETAQAAGVSDEMVVAAEAEQPVPPDAADAIEAFIAQLD